ncbi:MAG: hypothetical protein ACKOWF_19805 [Chloroflexota bacterium]
MTHPTEEQLLMYADDPVGPLAALAAHVGECASCGGLVATHLTLAAAVRADRFDTPPAATLLRAQQLMAERAANGSKLAGLMEAVTQPVKRIVCEIVFDSWGSLAPGLSGVRGVGGARHLTLAAGPAEFDLRLTAPISPKTNWSLMGQVSGEDVVDRIEFVSRKAAPMSLSAAADPTGMFRAELPEGDWDVIMHTKDFVYVLPKLPVRNGR